MTKRWGIALLLSLLACRSDTRAEVNARAAQALEVAHVPSLGWAIVTTTTETSGGVGGADAQTVYEAASIAKLVISEAVMQLVEAHQLELDSPVDAGFPLPPITLRQLLEHQSGIRDVDAELLVPRAQASLADFLRAYLAEPAHLGPTGETHYSNVGAALAALVVERAAHQSFAEYTQRHIFQPLGMTHTRWEGPAATPYAYRDGHFVALPLASHALYPVVDLFAPVSDLARFARACLRSDRPRLGWQRVEIAGRRVIGHEGEDQGASTGLYLDLSAGTGVVIVANGDAFASGDRARAAAIESLFGDLFAKAPQLIR